MKNTSPLVTFVINRLLKKMNGLSINSRCPLEEELASECDVSRTTVRKAYEILEKKGAVRKEGSLRYLAKKIKSENRVEDVTPVSKEMEVSQHLIDLISNGKIVPGQKISEYKLASSLGYSLSPVREALISLSPLGIFIKKTRKQWEVAVPDNKQFEELIDYRKIIELHCLQSLMTSSTYYEYLPKFESLLKQTKKLLKKRQIDSKSFAEVDNAFHQLLLKSKKNRLLSERSEFAYKIIDFQLKNKYFSAERAVLGLNQHIKIIEAILSKNRKGAIQELTNHLNSALESLKTINAHSTPATN